MWLGFSWEVKLTSSSGARQALDFILVSTPIRLVIGNIVSGVNLAELLAGRNPEMGSGIRRLNLQLWWLRPRSFRRSPAKPKPRRVRGPMPLWTLVTLDP